MEPLSPPSSQGGGGELPSKGWNPEEAAGRLGALAGLPLIPGSRSATFQVSHTHSGFSELCPRMQGQCSGDISLQSVCFPGLTHLWHVRNSGSYTALTKPCEHRASKLWQLSYPWSSCTWDSLVSPSLTLLDRLSDRGSGPTVQGDKYAVSILMSKRRKFGSRVWFLLDEWLSTPVL